jgi:lipopolysaccharide exporter
VTASGSAPEATAPEATGQPTLRSQVRRGLAWSGLSSLVMRGGNLLLGIALARLLAPEDFGVFAVALTVQTVLVTLADLGLGADLVRAERPDDRAPTIATLSLLSGALLTALMIATAVPMATAMGAPDAAPVVVVLSFTLLLSGVAVVPGAYLMRDFQQQKLFVSEGANFVLSTGVALALVLAGAGPMALAVSRLVGQLTGTALQFVLAGMRPRWGLDRTVARSALRFGVPLAAANMLSWALLNIDNVVVSRTSGVVALGFYVLAFNVSSWPMTAIGQAIRPVTLSAFAREQQQDPAPSLRRATALAAAAAAPVGALLAVLALPVVTLLYGERWAPSAAALAGLALFGGLRIVLDVLATFLVARGAVTAVLWIQVSWIVALVPAIVLGVRWGGLAGAGWAHLVVGVLLILPIYLVALRRAGAPVGAVVGNLWQPVLAMLPAALLAQQLAIRIDHPALAVLAAGTVGLLVYAAVLYRWVRTHLSDPAERESVITAQGPAALPAGSA